MAVIRYFKNQYFNFKDWDKNHHHMISGTFFIAVGIGEFLLISLVAGAYFAQDTSNWIMLLTGIKVLCSLFIMLAIPLGIGFAFFYIINRLVYRHK